MSQPARPVEKMSLGEQLRCKRVALGLSVEQAATAISALPKWIESIEANTDTGLPVAHYQSVLRRYANQLSVPLQPQAIEEQTALPTMRPVIKIGRGHRSKRRWPRRVGLLAIVVSVVGLSVVSGVSERAIGGLMNSQRLIDTDTVATVKEVRHISANHLPARPLNGTSGEQGERVVAKQGDGLAGEPDLSADESSGMRWSVHLRKDTWLELTDANGQSLADDLLRAASEYTFVGQPPFELLVGVGSAIELTLDNAPIDHLSLAEQGRPAGVTRMLIHSNGDVEVRQ